VAELTCAGGLISASRQSDVVICLRVKGAAVGITELRINFSSESFPAVHLYYSKKDSIMIIIIYK
jgi:hypothetical protein